MRIGPWPILHSLISNPFGLVEVNCLEVDSNKRLFGIKIGAGLLCFFEVTKKLQNVKNNAFPKIELCMMCFKSFTFKGIVTTEWSQSSSFTCT